MTTKIETAKMSSRGQITLPKDIREQLRVGADSIFVVKAIDDDTVVMKKLDQDKLVEQFREIREKTGKLPSEEIASEVQRERQG